MDINEMIELAKMNVSKDILLTHGSRGGLAGDIAPISRVRCDFGQGFYLCDNDTAAKRIIYNDVDPWIYKVRLSLSEIDPAKIWFVGQDEWLSLIFANRQRGMVADQNAIEIFNKMNQYDVIIGAMPDRIANAAITKYLTNKLTTDGLEDCIRYADLSLQYVLRTPEACSHAKIIGSWPLTGGEWDYFWEESSSIYSDAGMLVNKAAMEHAGQGQFRLESFKANPAPAPAPIKQGKSHKQQVETPPAPPSDDDWSFELPT